MKKSKLILSGLMVGSALSAPISANAYDTEFLSKLWRPHTEFGDIEIEVHDDYNSSSDDTTVDGQHNAYIEAEIAPTIKITDKIFADGVIVFEQMSQAGPLNANEDIWFDRQGLYIQELKVNYEDEKFAIWAGKFNPAFGKAWDFEGGIWSADFAEDYEVTEKVGFGGIYSLNIEEVGINNFFYNVFTNDRSWLTQSMISQRDQVRLQDGGAGNNEAPKSFTVGVDGQNIGGIERLNYSLSYRSQAEQSKLQNATTAGEVGYSAAFYYDIPVNDDINVDFLLEYTDINNFGGTKDTDQQYYFIGANANILENWNLTAAYTFRDIDATGTASDFEDNLFQLTAGYEFGDGMQIEAGWRKADEGGVNSDILGIVFRYAYNLDEI